MLKVKNKKIIDEIARTTYQANKKRNVLTIFAIILTTFLIAAVMALGVSYWTTISERQIRMEGMDYDLELSEPREDQVEKIRSMDSVEYAGVAVKCAMLEQYQDRSLDKTRLYWLDETCWEKQTIPALESYEGNYPKEENELMLSTRTLKAMGIQNPAIGMNLPVTYFTLAEDSDSELRNKQFVLCGWFTDYCRSMRGFVSKDFFETTGVKQTDFTEGALKITLKNPLYSEKDIVRMQNAINLDHNQWISGDSNTILNFCKTAAILAAMLLMIFSSGYLFIYSTLYISVSKDIRYYGQLKTVGMTSVQLKRMIYQQAIWNALIGIPLGLLAAVMVAKMILPQLLNLINPGLSSFNDIADVPIWVFLLAGFFALFTNLISSNKPAKMAGECSPIEALRYTTVGGRRKDHKRESGSTYSMAWQNLFRDKKQAAIIITSFIITISVFLVVNVIIRENDAKLILSESHTYDIRFQNETTLEENLPLITEDKIAEIKKIDGVKSVERVTSTEVVIPYQEEVYGEYYKELYQSRYSPGNYEEDMKVYQQNPANGYFTARFISVDERGFEILNASLGNMVDQEDFENGKVAVVTKAFTEGDNGITGKTVRFCLPDGRNPSEEHTIQIAAVGGIDSYPAFFSGGITPDLIVSEKYAKELLGDLYTELINVEYEKPFSKETEQKVKAVFQEDKQISQDSKLERYSEMKNSETKVNVLGNSIGFIIAMLAVLNYLNTMAASVQNRSKEFATLESIGMTTNQIKKMLRMEGAGYAVISIVISFVVGIPISYVVFNGTNLYRISFSVPWLPNMILFGLVLVLCMAVPVIIYQKTQNYSIIERLRKIEDQ